MSLQVKEVSEKLFSLLNNELAQFGFNLNKKEKCFTRVKNTCKQSIQFLFFKENNCVKIKIVAEVRITEVMNIYDSLAITKNPNAYTLGNDFFQIIDFIENGNEKGIGEQSYYLIENENDVQNTAKAIIRAYKDYILEYFNLTDTVEKADLLLNKNPRDISVHNWLYPYKAIMGIISAKINNNKNFNELLKIYSDELLEAADNLKQDFNNIIHNLNGNH